MNSAATYNYTPDEGWYVKSLKVDDVEQELTEDQKMNGGSYVFTMLNKNPIVQRVWRDGQILNASDSSYYTIEVVYARLPDYETVKTADKDKIYSMSSEPVHYTIKCTEKYDDAPAGSHQIKDDLAGGILEIVPGSLNISVSEGSTYSVDKQESDGLWVTFNSADAGGKCPEITISYDAKVNWSKYNGGKIKNTAEDTWEIDVVNNIVIAKSVQGKLRDTTKKFQFTVDLSNLDPESDYRLDLSGGGELLNVATGTAQGQSFRPDSTGKARIELAVKHGSAAAIMDLPMSAVYLVNEHGSDHIASYELSSDQKSPVFSSQNAGNETHWEELSTAEETVDPQDGQVTVRFINSKDMAPVTGSLTDTDHLIPGLMLLTLAGMIILFIKREEHLESENRNVSGTAD